MDPFCNEVTMKNISAECLRHLNIKKVRDLVTHASGLPAKIINGDQHYAILNQAKGELTSVKDVIRITLGQDSFLLTSVAKGDEHLAYLLLGPTNDVDPHDMSFLCDELIMLTDIASLPQPIPRIKTVDIDADNGNHLDLLNTLPDYDLIDIIYSLTKSLKQGDMDEGEALLITLMSALSIHENSSSLEDMKHYMVFAFSTISFELLHAGYHVDLNVLVIHNFIHSLKTLQTREALSDYCLGFFKQYFILRQERSDKQLPYPVNKVLHMINHRFQDPLRLADIADELAYSQRQLSRLLLKETGKTFTQLLTHARLQYAQLLLKEGTCSMQEVADQSGFSSISRFYEVFKNASSLTPRQYQRSLTSSILP